MSQPDRIDLKQGPPPVPPALVEWLELIFPDRFPDLAGVDVAALHRQAGRVEVIRLLRDHVNRQVGRVARQPQRAESGPF